MSTRFAIGYDSHRFADGRKLIVGGVEVPNGGRGLAGHSDADPLTHAIIDALLGAVALGDIGGHFPDTDERWAGAESLDLLTRACALVEEQGYQVSFIDGTVICEAPKLGPHRDAMRRALAGAAGLDLGQVSVKFTTNEGMDAVGRGEGIAALAVATVDR